MSYKYALQPYITAPEKYPDVVLFYDDTACIIKDAFPKSKVHLLILPRNKNISKLKPQEAFNDSKKIEMMKEYIERGIELTQKIFDKQWKRIDGKDKNIELITCCHSVPSLNNLHIHILTNDMCGKNMKNRKHYNSFQTNFAIKFDEFPLKDDDFRLTNKTKCELLLKQDLMYKGINFKNSFKKLQLKLQDDFNKVYKRI